MTRASHYLPLALRLLKSAAGLGALCWAVGVLLTYAGAHSFAVAAGYGDTRAWLFPITLDAVALCAYLALLMLPAGERWYPLLVVVLTAGASAAAQGYHQANTAPGAVELALAWPVRFAAGAWPAVAALMAGHLVWMILARAIPTGLVSALRSLATVDDRELAAETVPMSRPPAAPVARPAVDTEPVAAVLPSPRVHVPPVTGGTRDTDMDTAAVMPVPVEPLHSVPPVADEPDRGRPVGQSVPISEELLDRVRAGALTAAEAARIAGCSPKTIRRRLEAA